MPRMNLDDVEEREWQNRSRLSARIPTIYSRENRNLATTFFPLYARRRLSWARPVGYRGFLRSSSSATSSSIYKALVGLSRVPAFSVQILHHRRHVRLLLSSSPRKHPPFIVSGRPFSQTKLPDEYFSALWFRD
jgi:hypothetical protein